MRPLVIFYVFVIYILLQFCWWAYLLIDLNREVYEHKMKIVELTHAEESIREREHQDFKKNLHSRWVMVAGEGLVFLALLVIGINQTRKAFKKEFMLARQQKNFLLSITHEFKSPLAAIKLGLQTLKKYNLEKDKRESIIERSIQDTNRIQNLVENALTAAQLENRSIELNKVEFNLTELLKEIISGKTENIHFMHPITHRLAQDVYLTGDPLAIHSAIINLVENAEKYSTDNSETHIGLTERAKHIILRISDTGSGIPADQKEKVFEKFYRIENEETRKHRGTGLGLFIVKTVVELHNGKIFIKDNKPKGTIFEIIFKK